MGWVEHKEVLRYNSNFYVYSGDRSSEECCQKSRHSCSSFSVLDEQSSSGEVNSIEVLSERAGMRDNVAIIDLTTAEIVFRAAYSRTYTLFVSKKTTLSGNMTF